MSVEQRGYAPLPQSISNTDTEDEDEHIPEATHTIHKEHEDATERSSTLLRENGVFYPLDETRNLSNRSRNGQSVLRHCADDIPIMVIDGDAQDDLWKRRDMSPLRKFCLVVSILLCVATILIFLYVLPCDNSAICPPVNEPHSSVSWDKTFEGVEVCGRISIEPVPPYNLIFLLRGQHYGEGSLSPTGQIPSNGGGVLSIQRSGGTPLWWVPLKRLPREIDCVTLDTDGSGHFDCIVAGDKGLLVSIEPTAGTVHWSSPVPTHSKLPYILSDVDNDGIDDLLSVEMSDESTIGIVLLSGKSGLALGRYPITDCPDITLHNRSTDVISYSCDHSTEVISIKLDELLGKMERPDSRKLTARPNRTVRAFTNADNDTEQRTWELTPYYQLEVQNEGTCPGDLCQVRINITLRKSNESISIWDHAGPNSYAMKPVILRGQHRSVGFALKFWQWNNTKKLNNANEAKLVERRVIEKVMLVFLNHTEVRVINPSQTELLQLCRDEDCQPSLQLQHRSIAAEDFDGDGSWSLVSYQSTYNAKPIFLTSKLQNVKLDSLLSKSDG